MTKKSLGRQQRDKALAENTGWDDLNAVCNEIRGLLQSHAALLQLSRNPLLVSFISDKKVFEDNLSILSRDVASLAAEFNKLYKRHEGKTGRAKDPDDYAEFINLGQQYWIMRERHTANVMPIAYHLAEQFGEAEKLLQASNPKAAEEIVNAIRPSLDEIKALPDEPSLSPDQDPTVVSDAVIREAK